MTRDGYAAKSQKQPITFLDSISNYQKAVEVADGYGEKVTDASEVMERWWKQQRTWDL